RENTPSRLSTARPPRRPISIASLGPTTPSMAAAMIGMPYWWPHSSQETSTSLGLTVRLPGTSAISSKPYAALALRPRPTHIPMSFLPAGLRSAPGPVPKYRGCPARPSLDLVQYTGHPGGCQCSRAASPPLRASPQQAQPLQPEVLVHGVDRARDVGDQRGVAAGGDAFRTARHLGLHAVDEAVHQPGV